MTEPKIIIISACDDKYHVVANDLYASIRAQTFQHAFDLGLLDVGLNDANRQHFAGQGIKVEKVRSDIDYPARAQWEAAKPAVRTLTARPFLRNYFPGYDVYIWLDADVWVQTPEAINTIIASAMKTNAIHIAPELDRCYQPLFRQDGIWHMYYDWYKVNFGDAIAAQMQLMPMLNAGVFAMRQDAPVWDAWATIYSDVLQTTGDITNKSFMADQLGLNILIYRDKLPAVIMPPHYNWLTFFALPMLDQAANIYVEPAIPHRVISQFHLTRPKKLQVETIECLDGTSVQRSLMFSARNF
jgi:lipopolysaccharide biosynthesis glycosyltransferase